MRQSTSPKPRCCPRARNGTASGGSLQDVAIENTLIAGVDEVAIDAYSLQFLDLSPEAVPFLALGEHVLGLPRSY